MAKKNLHDTAALRALADGLDHSADLAEPETDPNKPGPHEQAVSLDPAGERQVSTRSNPARSRQQRSVDFQSKQDDHHGHLFRKTAIPLLLTMAGILAILAGVTLYLMQGKDPEELASNPLLDNGHLFAGISGVLALCLLAGAALFHFEVNRHNSQNGQPQGNTGARRR